MSLNALQDYTFISKYARWLPEEKRRETWAESVYRVRDMMHKKYAGFGIHDDINWAYDMMLKKRVLGSQRALQFGGEPILKKNARLYNCCASYCDRPRFFQEYMYLLLCGCGVGFSVQTHHVNKLPNLVREKGDYKKFTIPDNIEGWADALGILVASYLQQRSLFPEYVGKRVTFDYSEIRPEGAYLSSSSGKAPGPEPLRTALNNVRRVLQQCLKDGQRKLYPIDCYDILMHSSDAVLSGGVRRSSSIALFSLDDEDMLKAKTGNWRHENPQRGRSNNSVVLLRNETTLEQFQQIIEYTKEWGEPGFSWADNTEELRNPCGEVSLYAKTEDGESGFQFCNLSTINCSKIRSEDEFYESCSAATIIGTLQAGFTDFPYLGKASEEITKREALIGVSMTGMMEKPDICLDKQIQKRGTEIIKEVNAKFADKIGINRAARTCVIKPEGCRPANAITTTSQGILTLSEILENHDIRDQWSHLDIYLNCHGGDITQTFINGISKVNKIKLLYGIELVATPQHPWFVKYKIDRTKRSKRVEINNWVQTQDIQPNDVLDINLTAYTNGVHTELQQEYRLKAYDKHSYATNDITQPTQLNNDLAWLLGYLWGDGCMKISKYRLSFIDENKFNLEKVKRVVKENFNIDTTITPCRKKKAFTLEFGNKYLWYWLLRNDVYKYDNDQIALIPRIVRSSAKSDILAFIAGLVDSDGGIYNYNNRYRLVFTTSNDRFADHIQQVALACGLCFSKSLNTKGQNLQKQKHMWLMTLTPHVDVPSFLTFFENSEKANNLTQEYPWEFEVVGKNHGVLGKVLSVEEQEQKELTFDIQTEENWFYAGAIKSHNTASCMLGTSSGIHPHFAKRYFRRVQANRTETPYQFFKIHNYVACEESVWSANDTDEVITFCVEVPDGAKLKNQLSALDLLEIVKNTQIHWVMAGKNEDLCTQSWLQHSVSNTISVSRSEWDEVTKYIYRNRKYFAGVTLVPISSDKDYPQSPFTTVYLPSEIIRYYGDAAMFVSGLIVRALDLFDDDLWAACDALLGLGKRIKGGGKREWIDKAKLFADRYMDGDLKKLTYCLKDVNNWKRWVDLNREYQQVDYSELIEDEDGTEFLTEAACAGGKCDII